MQANDSNALTSNQSSRNVEPKGLDERVIALLNQFDPDDEMDSINDVIELCINYIDHLEEGVTSAEQYEEAIASNEVSYSAARSALQRIAMSLPPDIRQSFFEDTLTIKGIGKSPRWHSVFGAEVHAALERA